jgi:hypothetical protein
MCSKQFKQALACFTLPLTLYAVLSPQELLCRSVTVTTAKDHDLNWRTAKLVTSDLLHLLCCTVDGIHKSRISCALLNKTMHRLSLKQLLTAGSAATKYHAFNGSQP